MLPMIVSYQCETTTVHARELQLHVANTSSLKTSRMIPVLTQAYQALA